MTAAERLEARMVECWEEQEQIVTFLIESPDLERTLRRDLYSALRTLEAEGARLGEHVFTERRRQRIHEARASDPHQPRLL